MLALSRTRSLLFALGLLGVAAVAPVVTASAALPATEAQSAEVKSPPAPKRDSVGAQAISFWGSYPYSTGSIAGEHCWDHFAPPVPRGLPFAQVYRNCNGEDVRVHMGYYDSNGAFHEDFSCGWVPNGGSFIIVRSGADPGGLYGTWGC